MSVAPSALPADRARAELARRELERRRAAQDPAWFLDQTFMVDERTGTEFRFHLNDPTSGWYWQRGILDLLVQFSRLILLKARQLGMTWLVAGYGNLWIPLYRPGSLTLIYRQTETEAQEILDRVWEMWQHLPEHLRNGAKVLKPARGVRPSNVIVWEFPDGRISETRAMASTSAAGHGRTVAFALLDEFSRIEKAGEIMKSVQPAVGTTGKVAIVSTANGVSNAETGDGNYYHYLWENAKETGFHREFLAWSLHPDRNQDWYENSPEIRGLRAHERAEQYPANPHEAFTLTNQVWFDIDAMSWYGENAVRKPLRSYRFAPHENRKREAEIRETPQGWINEYAEPVPDRRYALAADPATARGRDYSAAYVIDLSTLEICAEFHGKLDADMFAYQLHYLGRRYNTAWLAIEMAGGYGDAVLIPLRDGRDGRPAYPNLYRHTLESRVDTPLARTYGYPMTSKTRPQVTEYMERLVRERALPYLTDDLLAEMRHFVRHETGPSPAAQQGTNDDRCMAAAVACELYRQRGHHPDRARPGPQKPYQPQYPWEKSEAGKAAKVLQQFRDENGNAVDRYGHPIAKKRRKTRAFR